MKQVFTTILFFVFSFTIVRAQTWVTLEDTNFIKFLQVNYPACMNGDQIDISCAGIQNAMAVDVSWLDIEDVTGIQYFTNLKTFNCSNNHLTYLPPLNNSLEKLDCSGNQIETVNATLAMTELFCSDNFISDLGVLPSTLKILSCSYNFLISLPTLPASLEGLSCYRNSLTALPDLPATLTGLDCSNNKLIALPDLPAGLKQLNCADNKLTGLPALSNTIFSIECQSNLLNSLPSLPADLTYLKCSSNKLTGLPALPAGLMQLHCGTNTIGVLPALPAALEILMCDSNKLTALPSLPAKLVQLQCGRNSIVSLPTLPSRLQDLFCNNNKLTTLPTLPSSVANIFSYNNQITALPALPDSLWALDLSNNPALNCLPLKKFLGNFINIDHTGITCMPNVVVHAGSIPAIDTLPLCGACVAPVFSTTKVTATAITVAWPKQGCIYNYRIAYRVKGTTTWTTVVVSANATTKTISGLTAGTQYEVRMRTACASSTLSGWTAIQTITTLVVCVPPSGIAITNIKKDRATFAWTAVANAYTYKLRYRVQGSSTWTNLTTYAPVVHKVILGLASNTTYEYQLLTVCDPSGKPASAWTGIATFKTLLRIGEEADQQASFNIYPNPASSQLTVSSGQISEGNEITMMDMLGRTLLTQSAPRKAQSTIDVSTLTPGVYFISLQSESGTQVRKFVKQ